jgi:hypothetical protein
MIPDCAFAICPPLEVLEVPGGKGRIAEMKNLAMLDFVRGKAKEVKFLLTSVCHRLFYPGCRRSFEQPKGHHSLLSLDECDK